MTSKEWCIEYVGFCCDTGYFRQTYRFDTYEEAEEFYKAWLKDSGPGKPGWSDGPEDMSPPLHESERERLIG